MNPLLTALKEISKNSMVKAAGTAVLAEVANHGIGGLYDKAMDSLAERIAQHLVDERIKKEEGEKDV